MRNDHKPCRASCTVAPSSSSPHIAPCRTQQTSAQLLAGARAPAMLLCTSFRLNLHRKRDRKQKTSLASWRRVSPPPRKWLGLEVQRNFRRQRARGYIVRSAERGQEVIQCVLVGDVNGRQVEVQLVAVGPEDVVFADGRV